MLGTVGFIEISKEVLQVEEVTNVLLDNFDVLMKEDHGYYFRMFCSSPYFDDLEDGEDIPNYHVDLKRDKRTDELYIWQVEKVI